MVCNTIHFLVSDHWSGSLPRTFFWVVIFIVWHVIFPSQIIRIVFEAPHAARYILFFKRHFYMKIPLCDFLAVITIYIVMFFPYEYKFLYICCLVHIDFAQLICCLFFSRNDVWFEIPISTYACANCKYEDPLKTWVREAEGSGAGEEAEDMRVEMSRDGLVMLSSSSSSCMEFVCKRVRTTINQSTKSLNLSTWLFPHDLHDYSRICFIAGYC